MNLRIWAIIATAAAVILLLIAALKNNMICGVAGTVCFVAGIYLGNTFRKQLQDEYDKQHGKRKR